MPLPPNPSTHSSIIPNAPKWTATATTAFSQIKTNAALLVDPSQEHPRYDRCFRCGVTGWVYMQTSGGEHTHHQNTRQRHCHWCIRTTIKEDIHRMAAEGTNLHLPGQLFTTSGDNDTDFGNTQIMSTMQALQATPTRVSSKQTGTALSTAIWYMCSAVSEVLHHQPLWLLWHSFNWQTQVCTSWFANSHVTPTSFSSTTSTTHTPLYSLPHWWRQLLTLTLDTCFVSWCHWGKVMWQTLNLKPQDNLLPHIWLVLSHTHAIFYLARLDLVSR